MVNSRASMATGICNSPSVAEVTGPIEALILTLGGRFVALEDLQGDGTTILQMRTAGMA